MAILLQVLAACLLLSGALCQYDAVGPEGRQVIPIPIPVAIQFPQNFPFPYQFPLPVGFPLTPVAYQNILPQIIDQYNSILQATASTAAATNAIINSYLPTYKPVVPA